MIKRPSDYDQTANFGEGFKTLPKGGYICRIIQAEETQDKNGRPLIHIGFDIVDGEYSNFFMNLYRQRKDKAERPEEVKWPFEGQAWIHVHDFEDPRKTNSKFKGFCTALEKSGTQVWSAEGNLLTANLKNAQVGVIFQNQEQEYNNKTYWRAVPWSFRSVEVIDSGKFYVPKDKPLANKNSGYGSYGFSQPQAQPQIDYTQYDSVVEDLPIPGGASAAGFNATSDDIPF